jgi:hypothetical protein
MIGPGGTTRAEFSVGGSFYELFAATGESTTHSIGMWNHLGNNHYSTTVEGGKSYWTYDPSTDTLTFDSDPNLPFRRDSSAGMQS